MGTDGNASQVWDSLSERLDTAVAGWCERQTHPDGRDAPSCHCVGNPNGFAVHTLLGGSGLKASSSRMLAQMVSYKNASLVSRTLRISLRIRIFNGLWFGDCHEYWTGYSDFEMPMRTSRRLDKSNVELHHLKVFARPSRNCSLFYVLQQRW